MNIKEATKLSSYEAKKINLAAQLPSCLATLKAFTLAEVLITLGIIGIVAAITIPALMQRTNDKELVAGTLKMGTVLSNALKGMEASDMTGVEKLDLDTFTAKFKTHLKTINCIDHSVCLADGGYFDYANDNFSGACSKDEPCLEINADVNGKKGPNKDGKDRYTFLVTKKGILPKGETTTCSGLDCTAYVLAEHKIWKGETVQTTPEQNNQIAENPQQETPQETPEPVIIPTGCSDANCSSCADGYRKNGGNCEQVNIANCTTYSRDKCSGCSDGYYVNGSSCAVIPNGLSACKSANSGMCSIDSVSFTKVSTSAGNYYVMTNPSEGNFDNSTCPTGTYNLQNKYDIAVAICGKTPATSQPYLAQVNGQNAYIIDESCGSKMIYRGASTNMVCVVEAD